MQFIKKIMILLICLYFPVFPFGKNPVLTPIPDNTAHDLGAYTCNQPLGNSSYCEAITDYSGFTYDKHHHQMLMFGGGHASTFRDDVDVFNFDSLKWIPAYNSTACADMTASNLDNDKGCWITSNHPFSRHTYDLRAVTEATGEFLLMRAGGGSSSFCQSGPDWYPSGRVGHYNPETKTWTYGAAMGSLWSNLACAESDPVSGLVIILSEQATTGLWTYDPVAKSAARRVVVNNLPGYSNNLVYYPPNDKFYMIDDGNSIFEVTLNRADWAASTVIQMTGITGDVPSTQETGWAYDSVNRIIGGGVKSGIFYAFDPLVKSWKAKTMLTQPSGSSVGSQAFHAIDYDPVNNVFIFITEGRRTWAYRYSSAGSALEKRGVPNTAGFSIQASPNPFSVSVDIRYESAVSGRPNSLMIYNSAGKMIKEFNGNGLTSGRLTWNASAYPPGVYLCEAKMGKMTVTRKLLLVR